MILLVQNPKLIHTLEQKNIDWNTLNFQGKVKFKQILETIQNHQPRNQGALLEVYRNHPDETLIKKLASRSLELPEEGIEKEFTDALDNLLKEAISTSIEKLCLKGRDIGLTPKEQQTLAKLLVQKQLNSRK